MQSPFQIYNDTLVDIMMHISISKLIFNFSQMDHLVLNFMLMIIWYFVSHMLVKFFHEWFISLPSSSLSVSSATVYAPLTSLLARFYSLYNITVYENFFKTCSRSYLTHKHGIHLISFLSRHYIKAML